MRISTEQVNRAAHAVYDAGQGRTFAARMQALTQAARGLLGPVTVASFTYDKRTILPGPGPAFAPYDFRREELWASDPVLTRALQEDYHHYLPIDPVPRRASVELHRPHRFTFDWGASEIETDFFPAVGILHDMAAGLDLFPEQGLAFLVLRGPGRPPFSDDEARAAQVLYDPVLLAVRDLLAGQELARLGEEGGEEDDAAGAAYFDAAGRPQSVDPAAARLLAAVATPPPQLAAWLGEEVRALLAAPPARAAEERVWALPTRSGEVLEARLSRLLPRALGAPRAALVLRRCPAGTQARFDHAADLAGLSPRERQVAELVCLGLTNREVAQELSISPQTVRGHLSGAFAKLRVSDRQGLRIRLLGP